MVIITHIEQSKQLKCHKNNRKKVGFTSKFQKTMWSGTLWHLRHETKICKTHGNIRFKIVCVWWYIWEKFTTALQEHVTTI